MYTIRISIALGAALLFGANTAFADTILAPYNNEYTDTNIGAAPGLTTPYGDIAFNPATPNDLYIVSGDIYVVPLTRNAANHITGFAGPASVFASTSNASEGIAFGPGNVLFYGTNNGIGEVKPGDTSPDKVIPNFLPLASEHLGGLAFDPNNPNHLVVLDDTAGGGGWFSTTISPDGSGTYNIAPVTTGIFVPGRPTGAVWLQSAIPGFAPNTLLVDLFGDKGIYSSPIDANGNIVSPLNLTPFISYGLGGGLVQDPLTSDMLYVEESPTIDTPFIKVIAPTPEPATCGLLLASVPFLMRRRRLQGAC